MNDSVDSGNAAAGDSAEGDAEEAGRETEERPAARDEAARRERPLSDEERAALLREQLRRLRVVDIAHDEMISLVTLGYQKLGLTDETRELRDLGDARLAIELLRAMVDVVARECGEAEVESFRGTLAQMQLNYARVVSEPAAGEQAAGRAAAAEEESAAAEQVPPAAAGDAAEEKDAEPGQPAG